MANDFYSDEQPQQPVQEEVVEEKIKLGEKEYTQEELNDLVGLGEVAKEYEQKWNRKIDQFWPDYTQKSQKLAQLEEKEKERDELELRSKLSSGSQLSLEEQQKLAREQAKTLGLVTRDEFDEEINKRITEVLTGKDLIADTIVVIDQAVEKGQPKTTVEELLRYMEENGVRKPDVAYKLKYEAELDQWKQGQLSKIRQPGLQTQETSTAGAKQPESPPTPSNREALRNAIREFRATRAGIGT